jgi:hypothetical protein
MQAGDRTISNAGIAWSPMKKFNIHSEPIIDLIIHNMEGEVNEEEAFIRNRVHR